MKISTFRLFDDTDSNNPIYVGSYNHRKLSLESVINAKGYDWNITGIFSNAKTNLKKDYDVYAVLSLRY